MNAPGTLDGTFAALGAGTRREILGRLAEGEVRLSDLAGGFDISQTAVSKHVRVLSDAGLVHVEKRGRTRFCRLDAAALQTASQWLAQYEAFWTEQSQNLGNFFENEQS